MKLLKEIALVLIIVATGDILAKVVDIPIPGSVIGMLLLLMALSVGLIKIQSLEQISEFLLSNLAFFFIPAGVGLMNVMGTVQADLLKILAIVILSTIFVMVTTGWTVQFLRGVVKKYEH
jgi:holin-like protein